MVSCFLHTGFRPKLNGNMQPLLKSEMHCLKMLIPGDSIHGKDCLYAITEVKNRGKFRLNDKRDRGDYMGVPSELNDAASMTIKVKAYWPNDYGLFNMAGNVSEWVMDIYRPLSLEDLSDINSFRGSVFKVPTKDEDGYLLQKDSLGRIQYRDVTVEENINRRNYKKSDNIGFLDEEKYESGAEMYDYGLTSLINNKARVYKGGSWTDNTYYQSPGIRRFLDENQSLRSLGFRCAMSHLGGSKNFTKNF